MGTLSKSNMCRLCGWEDEKNMRIEEQEVCIVINSMNLLTAKVSELIEQNMNLILETSLDLPDKICPECKTGVQVGHIQNYWGVFFRVKLMSLQFLDFIPCCQIDLNFGHKLF